MDHADHVRLLRRAFARRDPDEQRAAGVIDVWADLGAGTGAFTLALAELLPAGSTIHAVDRDADALEALKVSYGQLGAETKQRQRLQTHVADFTTDLPLRDLTGVLMANSLHFVRDKASVLGRVRALLMQGGSLLLVEYDKDEGNQWVPYPISFETWKTLAVASGFTEPVLLGTHTSRFMRRIYSASATRASGPTTAR